MPMQSRVSDPLCIYARVAQISRQEPSFRRVVEPTRYSSSALPNHYPCHAVPVLDCLLMLFFLPWRSSDVHSTSSTLNSVFITFAVPKERKMEVVYFLRDFLLTANKRIHGVAFRRNGVRLRIVASSNTLFSFNLFALFTTLALATIAVSQGVLLLVRCYHVHFSDIISVKYNVSTQASVLLTALASKALTGNRSYQLEAVDTGVIDPNCDNLYAGEVSPTPATSWITRLTVVLYGYHLPGSHRPGLSDHLCCAVQGHLRWDRGQL